MDIPHRGEEPKIDASGPFGDPDGSRAELRDLMKHFVTFGGIEYWGGLATREDDLTARVIVGRKGSGKTLYLRRIEEHTSTQEDLYADSIRQTPPTTEMVVTFCGYFEEMFLTEKWMQLWRTSIMRSLASHLMHSEKLNAHLSAAEKGGLQELISPFANTTKTPQSIYSQLRSTLATFPSRVGMTKYLDDTRWDDLENYLSQILAHCPPVCFFVDAVDEEFKHAPMYWQRCQKGLFYQVMKLLRERTFGGRLHVFIAIRDIVLSAVYLSEHKSRFLASPHIRVLLWNHESIKFFLLQKLKMLPKQYFMVSPSGDPTIGDWLGVGQIQNGRGTREYLIDYLIRHTRCIPRDIVILGNLLCREIIRAKTDGHSRVPRSNIRNAVGSAASFFADEELTVCANHLASDEMPSSAGRQGYSAVYTSAEEYVRENSSHLKKILNLIQRERFGVGEARAINDLWAEQLGAKVDLLSVLWQHRIIGYLTGSKGSERAVFHESDQSSIGNEFRFPDDKKEYIFHDIVLHAVEVSGLYRTRPVPAFGDKTS